MKNSTPESWIYRDAKNVNGFVVEDQKGRLICLVAATLWIAEQKEKATLISAAPDMRDALESLVENIISGEGGCDFIKKENLDKAIAALKKANGEKC